MIPQYNDVRWKFRGRLYSSSSIGNVAAGYVTTNAHGLILSAIEMVIAEAYTNGGAGWDAVAGSFRDNWTGMATAFRDNPLAVTLKTLPITNLYAVFYGWVTQEPGTGAGWPFTVGGP